MHQHFFAQRSSPPRSQYSISPARAVTYTATLLHPDDFLSTNGSGSSNASQVGQGYSAEFGGPTCNAVARRSQQLRRLASAPITATYAAAATDTYQIGDGYGPTTGGNFTRFSGVAAPAASSTCTRPASTLLTASTSTAPKRSATASTTTDFLSRALLWDVTTHSFTDLHPAGFDESFANGVSGDKQVGYGLLGRRRSARLTLDRHCRQQSRLEPRRLHRIVCQRRP